MEGFELKTGRDYGQRLWGMFEMPFGKWMGVALIFFFIFDEFRNPDRVFEAFMLGGLLMGVRDFIREAHKNSDDTSMPRGVYARKQLFPDVCYHLGAHTREHVLFWHQWAIHAIPRWTDHSVAMGKYVWVVYKG